MHDPTKADRQPMPNLRVLLADHSPDVRQRIRGQLQQLPGVETVGEAQSDQEVINLVFRLRPDAAIVSTCLPEQGGFEVLRCIKRVVPDCVVILTSSYQNPFLQQAANLLGAAGVCPTNDGMTQLGELVKSLTVKLSNGGGHYPSSDQPSR